MRSTFRNSASLGAILLSDPAHLPDVNVPPLLVAGLVLASVWLFAVPVAVLVHELGHAAAVRAFTDDDPTIVVGGERWHWEGRRFAVLFDPGGWRRRWYGFCRYDSLPSNPRREAMVHLGGPAATVVVLLAVVALVDLTPDGWERLALTGVFWWSAGQLAVTLAPVRYPESWGAYAGLPSDGLRAWRALTGE